MAISASDIDGDLAGIFQDISQVVTWDGDDYTCSVSSVGDEQRMMESGFMPQYDLTVTFRISQLPTVLPAVDDLLTIDGVRYRIVRIRRCPLNASLNCDVAKMA